MMVHFSCASCVSYRLEEEESREGSGEESGEEVETLCLCPDNFLVTVMLYNKHKPLDIQVKLFPHHTYFPPVQIAVLILCYTHLFIFIFKGTLCSSDG